jgi:GTP-binding protein
MMNHQQDPFCFFVLFISLFLLSCNMITIATGFSPVTPYSILRDTQNLKRKSSSILSNPCHIRRHSQASLSLFARKSGGNSRSPPSDKKQKNPTSTTGNNSNNDNNDNNGKKKKQKKSASSSGGNYSRASTINKTNQKKKAFSPPWQVVSKKDRTKNVKAEKERRTLAQEQGVHAMQDTQGMKLSKAFFSNEDKALLAWKRFKSSPADQVDFIGAYLNKQLPPRLGAPEIAFLGRSNVGKSSLLNKLVSSDSARVGKTPGATASVNLYGIFRKDKAMLGLVDLPGFGYAKLSKEAKEAVQVAAETYLAKRKELVLGILLVDIRRVPSDDDRAVLAALYDNGVPILVVATKIDKVSKNDQEASLEVIRNGLGLPEGQPLFVSSVTGQGIKDLWKICMEACEGGVEELRSKLLGQVGGNGGEEDYFIQGDDDELVYSQGFDWIHDSESVMYEDENGQTGYAADDDDKEEDEGDIDYDDQHIMQDSQQGPLPRLRELRKQVKDMEKRGEL